MGWGSFVKKVKNVVKDPVSWVNPAAAAQTFAASGGESPSSVIGKVGEEVQHGLDVVTGREAQRKAEEEMLRAADASTRVQYEMYQQGREDLAPWREAGETALGTLQERITAGPGEYTQSPGYQARLEEGQKSILQGRGNIRSGATEKALMRYGQDYATNDYDNFLQRYYQSLSPLQSLAGVGQTTASQQAQAGQQYGQAAGQNILRAGEQKASGYTDRYNALSGLIGQGAGLAAMTYGGPGWSWGGGAPAAASGGAMIPFSSPTMLA